MGSEAIHMTVTALDPPGIDRRRWRCRDCGLEGQLEAIQAQPCTKAKVGDLTPDQQVAEWIDGRSVCPSTTGECCPDFSCCQPKLQWPVDKRRKFAAADQGPREKMMMGSIGALLSGSGVRNHVTRGVPEDDQ